MKYLPVLLLIFCFNASAATPETCLEMNRAYWLTFETFSVENEDTQNRFLDSCIQHVDEPDFDKKRALKVGYLIRNDEHIQGTIQRLQETGLLTY